MTATRIAPPSLPAITLEEAKRHLRIDTTDNDDTLVSLIAAATDFLERDIGLALVDQSWRVYLDEVPVDRAVQIRLRPVKAVIAVTAYDRDGTPSELPGDQWFFNSISVPPRLRFLAGFDRSCAANGLETDVRAGFGESGADVPDSLKQALLALVAHWFEFRHAFAPEDQPVSVPEAYSRLTRSWRLMGL